MKSTRSLYFILVNIVVFTFYVSPAYAAPTLQADSPVQQCADGVELFLQDRYTEALPLLEAGFNGREKANFADPEDLAFCALAFGLLSDSTSKALEAFQLALPIFQTSHNRELEGTTLNNIGSIYDDLAQYEKALDYYQQALVIAQEVGDRLGEGVSLNNISNIYYAQRQYTEALDYLKQALLIEREIGDREGEAVTLSNIGRVHDIQHQYTQALRYYQQALVILRELGDRESEVMILNNIGKIHDAQSQYEQALDYYQQALDIAREVDYLQGEGEALNNFGDTYHSQGQFNQALSYLQQALVIMRKVGYREGESTVINNIGGVYVSQGQYAQALEYLQQALAIIREVGYREGEGATLNNIGGIYYSQGQYEKALDYFQQALAIEREVGDRTGEGIALNSLGNFYNSQGQYEQSLYYYKQALAVAQEVGDRAGEGNSLYSIGIIYSYQSQDAQALDYFQQALFIEREVGDREGEGITLNGIGGVYSSQGQYSQALDYYHQALEIAREVGDQESESITLNNLSEVYYSQDQVAQALEYYQQAIAVLEELRAIAGNDAARTSFIAKYTIVYQNAALTAHQLQKDEDAFGFSEQGRARSFLDAITTGAVELSDQPAAELITREQETYANLLSVQDTLGRAKGQIPPDNALISDLETQLVNAKQAHTEALQAIEARGDELSALVPGRSTVLSLEEVQNLMDDQTTLVSYFIIDDYSGALAFIITHDSFSVVELPNATPTNLKTAVEGLLPSLQDAHPQPLQDLYSWLIAPINNQIKTQRVGIIPHLTLHYISFAALTDGQTYFGEQYQLFVLPSASSLRYIQQHAAQATNSGAVIFGNPATNETGLPILPYAAAEADAVAQTLGTSDYIGTTATELQLRESVRGKAILHLAVHGAYNQYNPLYSALYLAPDEDGQYDGRLEVHEIFGLDLKGSQLVVLSACETQLGQLSTGDEVVGMTRAFMFAGTPSVLASLWQVDDEATQVLMTSFYKHWREDGMNKAEALQAAQADVRANPKWESPYYWAAFVLSGDVQTSPTKTATTPSIPEDSWLINFAPMVGGGMLLLLCLCCGVGVFSLLLLIGRRILRHSNKSD